MAAEFFKTFGVPIARGRGFGPDEIGTARRVVMVSETTARRLWPREEAVGKLGAEQRCDPLTTALKCLPEGIPHPTALRVYVTCTATVNRGIAKRIGSERWKELGQ